MIVKIRNNQTGEIKQVDSSQLPQYGIGGQSASPQTPQQQPSFLQGQGLPVGGAILGGTIGSLAGPVTGIAGAGAGYLGGDVIRKSLADLFGINRPETTVSQGTDQSSPYQAPINDIQNSLVGAGKQAALQGIGEGAAKVLGAVAHPIATVMAPARKALAESPAMIDISQFLTDLLAKGKNQFALKGMSDVFQPAYNALSQSIRDQASALSTASTPAAENALTAGGQVVAKPIEDITQANLNLPVNLADKIKSTLGNKGFQALEQYQRYGVHPTAGEVDLAKLANTMLSGQIKQEVPQVVLPDKLATLLNYIPNQAKSASYFLPGAAFGLGRSLRMGGNLVPSILQHLIPEGGGYLNQLLPALLQSPNLFQGLGGQQQ